MSVEISRDYVQTSEAEAVTRSLSDAWKDPSIPAQQLKLTDFEIARWLKGESVAPFDALRDVLLTMPRQGTLLEIGCGVGHNADVVAAVSPDITYTGVDYSDGFIVAARARRPALRFEVMDALMLDYPDRAFDIVLSGCCLLHIVNWRMALKAAARVAKRHLILHRTPIAKETQYFFKKAYGVECVEIHFSEQEIVGETCDGHGFSPVRSIPLNGYQQTYLFERTLFHHPV